MGKSEIVPMPRQESLYAVYKSYNNTTMVHTVEEEEEDQEELDIPENMELFTNQVAGHTNDGTSYGMIKHNGTILKPITKQKCGEREVEFYEEINKTSDQTRLELKKFVPQFYGKVTVPIKDKNIDCIVLEDLTKNFKEPCVMDIKIGRKTWDPTATYEKIMNEERKYQECKRDLAFCIPGFQVFKLNNQLCKFDKNYGKTLNKETVPQALRTFLNAESSICRSLIVQFLASLWRIQMWARKQRHYHFYSSSLLFVYDARRLRELLKTDVKPKIKLQRSTSLYRPLSLAVLNNENDKIQTGFSGLITKEGPILKTPTSPTKAKHFNDFVQSNNTNNVWRESIRTLKRTHSFQNDYDKDMQSKKQDYTYILDELCTEQKSELWATVKMIDFAHAFPAEHYEIDKNYLEGIDNLIRLFEELLVESE